MEGVFREPTVVRKAVKKKNQREKGYALINRLTGSVKLKVSVCYYRHACIPRR